MSEKPQKRLVSKAQYVIKLLDKGSAHAFAVTVVGSGIGLLIGSLLVIQSAVKLNAAVRMTPSIPTGIDTTQRIAQFSLLSVLSIGAIWYGVKRFKTAEKMESVTPITRHNTGELPAVETLVRASELPPSHHQAELLRAAQNGNATPAEELLRATQENRP